MSFFDRFRREPAAAAPLTDEQALQRYRYMLATAPPEDIERAHQEAFERLTPEQRAQALQALAREVPPGEIRGDDPASMARAATRAELREPGTIERAWGRGFGGGGFASSFLPMLAASFIGTSIAQSFFDSDPGSGADGGFGEGGSDTADAGRDFGGGDLGGGGGFDGGGDFGGGDFGEF